MAAGDVTKAGLARGWLLVAVAIVVVLLAGEVTARWLEPELAADRVASDADEVFLKRDRLQELAAQDASPDVLVVGASDLDSAVREQPFVTESDTYDSLYNASLLGLTPGPMQTWIDDALDIVDRPELLVVGVSLLTTAVDDRPAQRAVQIAQLEENLRTSQDSIGSSVRAAAEPSALVRNRTAFRQPQAVVEAARNQIQGKDDVRSDRRPEGFWDANIDPDGSIREYRDATYDPERLVDELTVTAAEINRPGGTVAGQLPGLLDHLAELDVEVVLVLPPVPVDDFITAGADPERIEALRAVVRDSAQRRDIPVLDYTTLAYPRSWFADRSHLNDVGSRGFSRDLAATLDGLSVPDRSAP